MAETPPKGLGEAGQRLWSDVIADLPKGWAFDHRELVLLESAARQSDVVADLEALVEREGMMSVGSTGQPALHPAVQEARQGRLSILRLLGQLEIPDADNAGRSLPGKHGQKAANTRWAREEAEWGRANG